MALRVEGQERPIKSPSQSHEFMRHLSVKTMICRVCVIHRGDKVLTVYLGRSMDSYSMEKQKQLVKQNQELASVLC